MNFKLGFKRIAFLFCSLLALACTVGGIAIMFDKSFFGGLGVVLGGIVVSWIVFWAISWVIDGFASEN